MSSQNVPPPPQYPNYSSTETSENSIMENSVIYLSDSGSPNYKTNRKNGYPYSTNQILPNLINSMNSTYQNLPPKSPKSNYRNLLNNNDALSKNNQRRQDEVHNEQFMQPYRPNQNVFPNKTNQQYSMVQSRDDDSESGFRDRNENVNQSATKTRSHPNLMNDYVNLAGTETLLNDILQNRGNRPFNPVANDSYKHFTGKPHQIHHQQFNNVVGPVPQIPEMINNGFELYPPQKLPECSSIPNSFSAENSRLVSILNDENKRLRAKVCHSDVRLEGVDHLVQNLRNMDMLYKEMMESLRRQRMLNILIDQANNASQNDDEVESRGAASCPVASTSDSNRPMDLRQNTVSDSRSTIPSSPVITQKSNGDSPGERSVTLSSKTQKSDSKSNFNETEKYLMENESPESWIEQTLISPVHELDLNMTPAQYQKSSEEDCLCSKLKQTIKTVNIATSPYFGRVPENQVSLINTPNDLLSRKMIMSPILGSARNWIFHQSSTPPSYRARVCQQQNIVKINNPRITSSPKATSALNLSNS